MTETFAALLAAHVLADFLFQTRWMVAKKLGLGLPAHGLVVLGLTLLAAGTWARPEPWALVAAHLVIDTAKAALPARQRATLAAFVGDQAAHLATITAAAALAPDLWALGPWAALAWAPAALALVAGAILATRAGGFAVGLLMASLDSDALPPGLTRGGLVIGLLERGLIFLLILVGQPMGIGFLIAAKSILRFETTTADQRASEYVIIGTLASFGWAMLAGWATLALLAQLPDIGIPALAP